MKHSLSTLMTQYKLKPAQIFTSGYIIYDDTQAICSNDPNILRDKILEFPDSNWRVFKWRSTDIFTNANLEIGSI